MAGAACGPTAEPAGVNRPVATATYLAAASGEVQEPPAAAAALLQAYDTSMQQIAEAKPHGRALLPSLQELQVYDIDLKDLSSLLQLTQAPQLTSLTVKDIKILDTGFSSGMESHRNEDDAVQQVAEAMPHLLQQLPRLTAVNLPALPITDAAAAPCRGCAKSNLARHGMCSRWACSSCPAA